MSRFSGRQYKGAAKVVRELKKDEANERNLKTAPERRRAYRKNEQLRASLARGLAQSATGRVSDLGDFTKYAADQEE